MGNNHQIYSYFAVNTLSDLYDNFPVAMPLVADKYVDSCCKVFDERLVDQINVLKTNIQKIDGLIKMAKIVTSGSKYQLNERGKDLERQTQVEFDSLDVKLAEKAGYKKIFDSTIAHLTDEGYIIYVKNEGYKMTKKGLDKGSEVHSCEKACTKTGFAYVKEVLANANTMRDTVARGVLVNVVAQLFS